MPEIAAILLVALIYLASTVGAGIAASDLFAWLRTRLACHALPHVGWLLARRIGARLMVMAFAVLISVVVLVCIALLTGLPLAVVYQISAPGMGVLGQALAAIVASQLYHLKDMRGQMSADVAGFTFTPEMPGKDADQ